MAYEDKRAAAQSAAQRPHALTLTERAKLTVTGVDEVVRFDETEVEMRTARGGLLVRGSGLRVGSLAIDTGELRIDGAVLEIVYEDEPVRGEGFFARLFG